MFFANPLFLIALIATAIPVVVHLFNLRRYRKVYFSNVERIEELRDETRRQSRLRDILLLVCRIMTIVFLVLAFAQPTVINDSRQVHGSSAVSIYVDNSMSMRLTDSEGILLQRAKEKAKETAAAYKHSDLFQLITDDMDGSQFRWMSRDEFLLALDEIDITPVTTPLSTIVARQHDFLAQSHAANRYAYIISDMQQSTSDLESLPDDTTATTTIIPIAASGAANIYFDTLFTDAPAYHRGSVITVHAVLTNSGETAVEKVPVRLFAAGIQRAMTSTDLPAHGAVELTMTFVADMEGAADCYVETTDYPLTFDDRLYFSVNISSSMAVLAIGQPNEYIAKLFASDSLASYKHIDQREVDYATLDDYNLIIVNEPKQIPSGLADALQHYVDGGGTLLLIPASDGDITSYNNLLAQVQAPRLASWSATTAKGTALYRDAALYRGVFHSSKTDDMEMPTVKGHYRLSSSESTIHEPLIALADGDSYLSATTYGEGCLYLFASPLTAEHSDLMQQALFVPTILNMAIFSRTQQMPYYTFDHPHPIPLPHDFATGHDALHLVNGDIDIIPQLTLVARQPAIMLRQQLHTPGNYRLLNAQGQSLGISFNYSNDESLMLFLDNDEIEQALRQHASARYELLGNSQRSVEQYIKQRRDGRPLWHWCIILALLMLMAETAILKWPTSNTPTQNKSNR